MSIAKTTAKSGRHPLLVGAAAVMGGLALSLGTAAAAHAHVSVSTNSAEAGSYAVLTFGVPHGCDASPTTEVAIQIPEGINTVTPTRHAFYDVEKVMETLDTPITDSHGNDITERVAEVVYTASTPLPSDQRDALELSLQLPEDAAGDTLYFPTLQTCEQGETAWVQIPADGQDSNELDAPAPAIDVVAAGANGHEEGATEKAATDGSPTPRADADDEGVAPLQIAALGLGALGVTIGGIALIRSRKAA